MNVPPSPVPPSMQQYGDNWAQSMPHSPASQQYHSSPLTQPGSSGGSNRKKDKDKDRSDKSSRRDGRHSKRNSATAAPHSTTSSGNNSTFATPPLSMLSNPPSPTTPPSPPSPPLPPLRVDLHSRHQALNAVLTASGGEARVASYWSVIELFLRAQLSKAELDTEVKRLIGDDSLAVHNDFFFALLQNAMSEELPSAAKAKRDGREADGGGSTNKGDKAEKVKREGVEVTGKDGQKVDGKEGKKDKKEGKRDKSGVPLPLTPTAASAASPSAVSIKLEDKREGKRRKDGTLKAEKDGRRDKRRERHEEEEAMDWTEQAWPSPSPPQRWGDISQASVHREMKHILTASEYFATLRRERERRGVGREVDKEEGGREGGEWLWAIDESKVGYLRVKRAENEDDASRASVNHAVALIRRRARSRRRETEESKEDDKSELKDERADGGDAERNVRPPAWLNPASSTAYRTSPLSLPSMPSLRARCLLAAKHGGLKTVSESALSLIHQAMTQYVRMLLSEMIADRTLPRTHPASAPTRQQGETGEGRTDRTAMEMDVAVSSSSSPAAESSSSSPALLSAFPASCFAPSLFAPPPSDTAPDASVKAEASELQAADSTSLVRLLPSASTSTSTAAGDPTLEEAGAPVKMDTEASSVPTNVADTSAGAVTSDSSSAPPQQIAPPSSARSLSVSVPMSPPSLAPSTSSPRTPSRALVERARRAAEEKRREAEDDTRNSFPFLIARQPAYRAPPPPPPPQPPPPPAALSVQRSGGLDGGSPVLSAGALSLSEFLEYLRDRRSAPMRVADDLPILLERLIIVQ